MTASKNPARISPRNLLLAGLVAGGLAGWLMGHYTSAAATDVFSPNKAGLTQERKGPRERENQNDEAGNHALNLRSDSDSSSNGFAESARSIFRETIQERRVAMFESLLEKMAHQDYPAMVSLIRENDLQGRDSGAEWTKLWSIWGRRDPTAAMRFFRSQDWSGWHPDAPGEAKNRALISWAQTDPEATRRFVEEGAELAGGDRSMVFGLVEGWANVNHQAAADWLLKSGLGMDGEYKSVINALIRRGGYQALDAWFSKIDQGGASSKDKSGFAQAIAESKQKYEPEKAAAWVEQNLNQPWLDGGEIVESTARAFAMRDPMAAMAWAQRTGLESAATATIEIWCQQDIQAASVWLGENPQIAGFPTAATAIVEELRRSDPAAARAWVNNVSDQAVRAELLSRLPQR